MTDTSKYLTRMVIFLVVVGAGAGFIADTIAQIFLVNPLLNGLIVAVTLTGIALNFRQVLSLAPEARWIDQVRELGNAVPSDDAADAEPGLNALRMEHADAKLKLLSPMARMLAEKRARGRIMLSAPAMRTLLDGIASRLEENRDLARYFTGLCIFLGLLGTFWGLLGTVRSVGDVIRQLTMNTDDIAVVFNHLKEGLEAPLSSMGTAFSASLLGLGGSLILGFLDLQAGQAQNAFYNDLEEWLSGVTRLSSGTGPGDSDQGVSAYTEALLEQTAESLQELQTIMARGEQNRVAGNQQLADLTDKLGLLGDHMRTEQQVLLRVAENQRDLAPLLRGLTDAVAGMNDPGGSHGIDDATRSHIRNIDVGLGRLAASLAASRDDTLRELRAEIKLLARTIASSTREGDGA